VGLLVQSGGADQRRFLHTVHLRLASSPLSFTDIAALSDDSLYTNSLSFSFVSHFKQINKIKTSWQ